MSHIDEGSKDKPRLLAMAAIELAFDAGMNTKRLGVRPSFLTD